MNTTKLALAASFFSAAIMFGAGQNSAANAAPLVQQSQLAQFVKADTAVKEVGWKKRRLRRFLRHNYRHGRWCHNHPRRCYGYRGYRGYRYGVGYGARYGVRKCHRHEYKVPGMHFHPGVRCGHRHYRAYRSWTFVR